MKAADLWRRRIESNLLSVSTRIRMFPGSIQPQASKGGEEGQRRETGKRSKEGTGGRTHLGRRCIERDLLRIPVRLRVNPRPIQPGRFPRFPIRRRREELDEARRVVPDAGAEEGTQGRAGVDGAVGGATVAEGAAGVDFAEEGGGFAGAEAGHELETLRGEEG
jgi:hypothetical protein